MNKEAVLRRQGSRSLLKRELYKLPLPGWVWLQSGMRRFTAEERGGVHLLCFAMFGVLFAVLLWLTALNWMLQTGSMNRTKPLLDHAAHAAALSIDRVQAAYGRLAWDEEAGTQAFYRSLQQNLRLTGDQLQPQNDSSAAGIPVIHLLEFVTNPVYPYVLQRTVTVNQGTSQETVRHIEVTIYGPSVVAAAEISRPLIGLGRSESIVISTAANVRLR